MGRGHQRGSNYYSKQSRIRRVGVRGADKSASESTAGDRMTDLDLVAKQQHRAVTCKCGWSGTIGDLQPAFGPDGGFRDLGDGFPVCPECRQEGGLKA